MIRKYKKSTKSTKSTTNINLQKVQQKYQTQKNNNLHIIKTEILPKLKLFKN